MEKEILEQWIDIDGYVGFYQVSNLGRVKSLSRIVRAKANGKLVTKERILVNVLDKNYLVVSLSKEGRIEQYHVHRLVCFAFKGHPPSSEYQVCHNDGNKLNNKFSNLRWGTGKDNSDDAVKHGTKCRGSYIGSSKFTEHDVRDIRNLHGVIPVKEIAMKFDMSVTHVWYIIKRKAWAWLV